MKILVTGGTTFVSQRIAEFFVTLNHEVYVLNRGNKPQITGVKAILLDRHESFDLSNDEFDVVIDVTAYTRKDVQLLLNALNLKSLKTYVLISSSAVYSEKDEQPFKESLEPKENIIWGKYGMDKIEAERMLQDNFDNHYIIRPPYLYGPGNNVYREAFVFDCAKENRPFYLPEDGSMPLQFFYIDDLCKIIELLIDIQPQEKILNVGNPTPVTIKEWVKLCYEVVGNDLKIVNVPKNVNYRNYFPFYNYAYQLDTSLQEKYLKTVTSLERGLKKSFEWYQDNEDQVKKKPLFEYIKENLQ